MKFANFIATQEHLISPESVADMVPVRAIAQDPKDIPDVVLNKLTPTLETDEKDVKKQIAEFPDNYVPSTLAELAATTESLDYHSQLSGRGVAFLCETLESLGDGQDISKIGVTAIQTQVSSLANALDQSDSAAQSYLEKALTSNGPYNSVPVMEGLQKTIDTVLPVASSFLNIPAITAKKLESIASSVSLEKLTNCMSYTERVKRPIGDYTKKAAEPNLNIDQIFPKLQEFAGKQVELMDIRQSIQSKDMQMAELPLVAIRAVLNSMSRIKLQTTRSINDKDIQTLSKYLKDTVAIGQAHNTLLEEFLKVAQEHLTSSDSIQSGLDQLAQSVKEFYQQVKTIKPSSGLGAETYYVFNMIQGGQTVTLGADGKTQLTGTQGSDSHGFITHSGIKSIFDAYTTDVVGQFDDIKSVYQKASGISAEILKVLQSEEVSEAVKQSGMAPLYCACLSNYSKAVKLAAILSIVGISFCEDLEYCMAELCRGIGVIVET